MAIAVIDPGHGGTSEVGGSDANHAEGPMGLLEKDLTLDLARRVCKALNGSDVEARLTRDADRNLGLKARADIARQARADAFVSIHFNGFDHSAQGTETWHHRSASSDSKALATLVQTAVCKATGLKDRGVKSSGFGVLRPEQHAATTAACLVEVSFMDVAAEEARLETDAYKDKIAAALAGAVKGWLVADGRMARPELLAATATPRTRPEAEPQDGYDVIQLDDAQTSERAPQGEVARMDPAGAPRPAGETYGGDLSLSIGFLANPRERAINSAAGVEDLGAMLRGWRKERLCPPDSDGIRPEIIIGRDESLEAAFLERLARQRQAVGIVRTEGVDFLGRRGRWSGTGFLVAPNILLTNHHVLNSPEVAEAAEVAFDYELSAQALASGRKTEPAPGRRYRLRPDRLFVTSPIKDGLDYSFVGIEDVQLADGALIRMERVAFAIQPEERAFIIHHPSGRPKRVSLDDTDIVTARPDGAVLHYTSDTEPGSSGAPVFDRSGRLIALHHASQPNRDGIQDSDGLRPEYVNEGIKLAAIALDLEARRGREANAMIDVILGEVYGSDTLSGFFGAAGRQVDAAQPGAERVVDLYNATTQDIDIGFWNIEWFANRYDEKVDEIATMIVDLGLDLWALVETSPPATAALAETIERKFGLPMRYLHSEPDSPESKQTTAVLWNPGTVDGEQLAWPAGIDALFRLRSGDFEAESQVAPKPGKIFDRYPALFRFRARSDAGDGVDFNLVPLHLKAMAEGWKRRRMASQILARAVKEMIERHDADQDWVLGGDFNAELASGDFDPLIKADFKPLSAQDEAAGAVSYLKSPHSLIDHVFLSPNMSRLYGPQDFFILAREKSQVDYLKRFSDHRPVLLRLSARSAGTAPEQWIGPDRALDERIDAALRRARGREGADA
ncbi:N-acetylmuramoyl-L-alanine amidase [Massilia litorea]|uniref:Serine protease n=1 Tax=Massilia litorea TaxID=2769491 RepID=A0A7L9U5T5_9BURK|nr:N-acetylmuramoyl-L-alanine amidase [Massilia litorea]QOL50374.1 N-acetylmuramoyl-L-alanine amidase [Massilia litorea]